MVNILFEDEDIIICEKLPGMISQETSDDNSLPHILNEQTGAEIFVLHRLDIPTGGAIMYAKNGKAASAFSVLISNNIITKGYFAVIDGCPDVRDGIFHDLLFRDKQRNKTYVVKRNRKGVKDAELNYSVVAESHNKSLVKIRLVTGRTHQIRVQFASRKIPVTGDGKYGSRDNKCNTALWSHSLTFTHPFTGEIIDVKSYPPSEKYPWCLFQSK